MSSQVQYEEAIKERPKIVDRNGKIIERNDSPIRPDYPIQPVQAHGGTVPP
ncbi:MAG: hypothetical protein V1792_16705 [Pseudomonadota bacterium]